MFIHRDPNQYAEMASSANFLAYIYSLNNIPLEGLLHYGPY